MNQQAGTAAVAPKAQDLQPCQPLKAKHCPLRAHEIMRFRNEVSTAMGEAEKKQTPRYRRMCITMENYQKHELDHASIARKVLSLTALTYACFDLEVSESGVPHCHLYVVFENQRNVKTMKELFGEFIHIEKALGTHEECIAYCEKSGEKHADKKHTQVEGSFWETGVRPATKPDSKAKWTAVYELAKSGELSALEILEEYPTLANQLSKIELLVEKFRAERSKKEFRSLKCLILHGKMATGKTTWAYKQFGDSLYRVTDYQHPYDSYQSEKAICYDEFDSTAEAVSLSTMLQLTDVFPLGGCAGEKVQQLGASIRYGDIYQQQQPQRLLQGREARAVERFSKAHRSHI